MSELLLRGHLGLGDHLITNAIVRHLAAQHTQVVVLCKQHNTTTLNFLWRDLPAVETFSIKDDAEADDATRSAQAAGFTILGLGGSAYHAFGHPDFNTSKWDQEFYRQANIPFQDRWSKFVCARQPSRELPLPKRPFTLIHDDPSRNARIDRTRLPKDLVHVHLDPTTTANLFDWWAHIERATELHFMESSPAILADSLPELHARRKVIHHYCRKSIAPSYQANWEHLY